MDLKIGKYWTAFVGEWESLLQAEMREQGPEDCA